MSKCLSNLMVDLKERYCDWKYMLGKLLSGPHHQRYMFMCTSIYSGSSGWSVGCNHFTVHWCPNMVYTGSVNFISGLGSALSQYRINWPWKLDKKILYICIKLYTAFSTKIYQYHKVNGYRISFNILNIIVYSY